MKLNEYLKSHTVLKIGCCDSSTQFYEIIVDNPVELVSIVLKNGFYISAIRWWDRAKISIGSQLGYGGPRDPSNPNTYFFAETDLYKEFDSHTEGIIYCEYIDSIIKLYPNYELIPAFDIIKKQ